MEFKKVKTLCAFTLAEVLITLGIIGVVAAITLPAFIENHKEKETVTKVKKMYSLISNAYQMNIATNGPNLGTLKATNAQAATEVATVFLPYLSIMKDCGTTKRGCVYNGTYKYKSGGNAVKYDYGGYASYRVLLNDGSSIWFRKTTASGNPSAIFYDVNGPKSPNTWGKDLFLYIVVEDKVIPAGSHLPGDPYSFDAHCSKSSVNGVGCTAWVINEGNLEYLRCSDLQYDGPKKKCQ